MSTTAAHFEGRHRELREMRAQSTAAWMAAEGDGVEVIAAERRLDAFHERTDPLVDDLVAAVRARRARHPDGIGRCICVACESEECALAALDEAATAEPAGR